MLTILDLPQTLRPAFPFPYPGHQRGPLIEEFAHRYLAAGDAPFALDETWTYVSAYWTSYACAASQRGRLGRYAARRRMQHFLATLPRGQNYFTVSQHDDGLCQRGAYQPTAPIYEFSAGGAGDVPIPLLCDPHTPVARRRDIRASFIGALGTATGRYPLREAMAAALSRDRGLKIEDRGDRELNRQSSIRPEYLIRDVTPVWGERNGPSLAAKTAEFVEIMCRSVFALCPRGYGRTSFRLYEAMQLGCVPVYIYDEPWLPYADVLDWTEFCVLVPADRVGQLHEILASKTQGEIDAMRQRAAELWPEYFTPAAVMRQILRYLNAATAASLHRDRQGSARAA